MITFPNDQWEKFVLRLSCNHLVINMQSSHCCTTERRLYQIHTQSWKLEEAIETSLQASKLRVFETMTHPPTQCLTGAKCRATRAANKKIILFWKFPLPKLLDAQTMTREGVHQWLGILSNLDIILLDCLDAKKTRRSRDVGTLRHMIIVVKLGHLGIRVHSIKW